jgi:hypothetical protein
MDPSERQCCLQAGGSTADDRNVGPADLVLRSLHVGISS